MPVSHEQPSGTWGQNLRSTILANLFTSFMTFRTRSACWTSRSAFQQQHSKQVRSAYLKNQSISTWKDFGTLSVDLSYLQTNTYIPQQVPHPLSLSPSPPPRRCICIVSGPCFVWEYYGQGILAKFGNNTGFSLSLLAMIMSSSWEGESCITTMEGSLTGGWESSFFWNQLNMSASLILGQGVH